MMNSFSSLSSWHTHTFPAMGSQITLWLESDKRVSAQAFAQIEALFVSCESALSRFLPQSELSWLNGRSGMWTPVSDLMWNVLSQALTCAGATDGLFDPTVLNALEMAGYTHSFEELAAAVRYHSSPSFTEPGRWEEILLDETAQAVYLPPGIRIDLGGIAKGYTAQQAVALLSNWGPCLVDAGGDLTAGAAPTNLPGWPVALAAPAASGEAQPDSDLLRLWLANASLATSGVDYRRWRRNGRDSHHLIDPRTGSPAQTDVLTVTVWAGTAVLAETWATAACVMGTEPGRQILNRQSHLAAAFVDTNNCLTLTDSMQWMICGA